jgi:hypothetical protein
MTNHYCAGGIFVVSGGIVFIVSVALLVSTGTDIVVSTFELSEEPDTFFVELQAKIARVIVLATAMLKINFFIWFCFKFNDLTTKHLKSFDFCQ